MSNIKRAIQTLGIFHDASPLNRYAEFCIKPTDFQIDGVPTPEFANSQRLRYAVETAIEALQEKLSRNKNEPLTLDELKQMDGGPVWVETPNKSKSEWAFVKQVKENGDIRVRPDFHSCINLPYSKVKFYRRKPEPISQALGNLEDGKEEC